MQTPISKNFSFATQFLKDVVNNCDQERTLSTIRTSEKTAYYLDIFRSKSLDENKFHDYVYHNIGDATSIENEKGNSLSLENTDRYNNDIGDLVKSPGWAYFENTQVTKPTNDAVNLKFNIKDGNRNMNIFFPKGNDREYTIALAPPSREAEKGYLKKKTQVVVVRQNGEAWNKPYLAIFEPTVDRQPSVQNVELLVDGEKTVGAKVVSKVDNSVITDYIISQDNSNAVYTNTVLDLKFEGRFGIVRIEEGNGKKTVSLYIGEGKQLTFGKEKLSANAEQKGFKVF